MPVLATIAGINLIFRSDANEVGFLDPVALRVRCKEVLEDIKKREQVLKLTEELLQLAGQYEKAVSDTVDAYLVESKKWQSTADGLIEILAPWDDARNTALQKIVEVRSSMHKLLSKEQWELIFG